MASPTGPPLSMNASIGSRTSSSVHVSPISSKENAEISAVSPTVSSVVFIVTPNELGSSMAPSDQLDEVRRSPSSSNVSVLVSPIVSSFTSLSLDGLGERGRGGRLGLG